jgi:hypothetical protein
MSRRSPYRIVLPPDERSELERRVRRQLVLVFPPDLQDRENGVHDRRMR